MKYVIVALLAVSCIVNGNLMICTDLETGQTWTLLLN